MQEHEFEKEYENVELDYENLNFVQSQIIKALWKHNKMHRNEICKKIGIARTTVHDNIKFINKGLVKRGILKYETVIASKRGRPVKNWFLTEIFKKAMESVLKNG